MFYFLSEFLKDLWGPFRLLQSHMVMMGGGAALAALSVWLFLPRTAKWLPRDRGKAVRRLWRSVVAEMQGVVTFDLYYCGLVFFDKKRFKQNYVINF